MRWKRESSRQGIASVKAVQSEEAKQVRAAKRPELPQRKVSGAV